MGSASATEMAFEIAFKRARRRTSNYFPFCRERLNQKGHQRKAHLLISPGKGSYEMPLSSNRLQKIERKWNKENLGNMEDDIHKLGLVQNCFYIVPNGITTARDHSDGGVLQNFNFIFQRTGLYAFAQRANRCRSTHPVTHFIHFFFALLARHLQLDMARSLINSAKISAEQAPLWPRLRISDSIIKPW